MGWNDHFDQDFYDRIQELVDAGELEEGTPAYGVAQQVVHEGYESLMPKQRGLYDAVVLPLLADGRSLDHPEDRTCSEREASIWSIIFYNQDKLRKVVAAWVVM